MSPAFRISDDGKYLALWAHDPETPGEKKQKDAKIDASWVNHERHLTRLYLAALKPDGTIDGDLKAVDIAPDVHGAVWSPVADKLFVVTEEPNDVSDLKPAGAAWIVDADFNGQAGQDSRRFRPLFRAAHGRPMATGSSSPPQTPDDAPPGYEDLYALNPVNAETKPLNLTHGFNGQMRGQGLYFTSDGAVIAPAAIGTVIPSSAFRSMANRSHQLSISVQP